jgi:metal-responsive CopG/Arc/MetJ family transcriptional regulator
MTRDETAISLKIPTGLVNQLDTIAKQKYMERNDIIIDACAYYCQFYDMNNERLPETTRTIFFNLARYDDEFRKILREAIREDPGADLSNQK